VKGHENKKKYPIPITDHGGKMVRNSERKKMHTMCGSKDLYSRILGGIGKGLKNSSASFLCIQETYFISTISQFESD
jgi:hypothetical protein